MADDDDSGFIPIIEAAKRGNDGMIEDCVSEGEDPKKLDAQGNSALHWAAAGNHVDAVNLLIKLGLDVNQRNKDGETPLHKAAWKDHALAAQALVIIYFFSFKIIRFICRPLFRVWVCFPFASHPRIYEHSRAG